MRSWHADDVGGGGDDSDSSDDSDDGRRGGGGGGGAGGDGAAYVVKAFGVDERGASVGLTVRGFTPFFYVRLAGADAPFWKEAAAELTRAHGRRNGLLEARPFAKKDFWGFSHGRVDTFLRLSFRTQRGMRFAAAALRKEPAVRAAGREVQLRLYESNIDPLLRLFHCADLEPAGWVRAARARPASGALRSCCQVDLECDWKDLRPARRDEMAPLLIAAFDIECNRYFADLLESASATAHRVLARCCAPLSGSYRNPEHQGWGRRARASALPTASHSRGSGAWLSHRSRS